jgi:hypothetical protein
LGGEGWGNPDGDLTDIAVDTFTGLTGLTSLSLYFNNISKIAPGAFSPAKLPKLRSLDLRRNALTTVPSNTVSGLPELTELDLADNKIADVAPDAFSGLPKLTDLDLRNNPLTNVKATDLLPVAENPDLDLELPGSFTLRRLAALEARCPSAGQRRSMCGSIVSAPSSSGSSGPAGTTSDGATNGVSGVASISEVDSPPSPPPPTSVTVFVVKMAVWIPMTKESFISDGKMKFKISMANAAGVDVTDIVIVKIENINRALLRRLLVRFFWLKM